MDLIYIKLNLILFFNLNNVILFILEKKFLESELIKNYNKQKNINLTNN